MVDWTRLLDSLRVPNWTSGKNCTPGRVNIQCPLCGDHSNHGSFGIDKGDYQCWRCPGCSPTRALSLAARLPLAEAQRLIRDYTTGSVHTSAPERKTATGKILEGIPGGALEQPHIDYLHKRNFRAQQLVERYGIKGTGPTSIWKGSDFRLRIIIPIYDLDGNLVNFQGRDITGKQDLRYKGCPVAEAGVHHKHLLYGAHLARDLDRIVVVEGVFDQWRMGPGSVATFGTSMTREQVSLLTRWPEVVFLFDPEDEAQEHARAAARDIASCGNKVWVARADLGKNPKGEPRDPGDLTPLEAQELMAELMRG